VSNKAKILVTGASGFIGRCVVPRLVADGYCVRAAGRRAALPEVAAAFASDVETVQIGDLQEGVNWRPLLDGVDVVVHLAGIARTDGIAPAQYDRINREATAELVLTAAVAGVRRFVFVSSIRAQSGAVAHHILNENDPPQPTEPYGRSKLAAEIAVQQSGVPFTVLRPVIVYGAGVQGNFRQLIRAAALPLPLPLGAFTAGRSLLNVHNLASAIVHVLGQQSTCGETYLVADPQPLSLAEIITALRRGMGRSSGLIALPPALIRAALTAINRQELFDALASQLIVDPRKLIASGWQPLGNTAGALADLTRR